MTTTTASAVSATTMTLRRRLDAVDADADLVLSWSAAAVPEAACSAGATPKKKAVRSVAPRV